MGKTEFHKEVSNMDNIRLHIKSKNINMHICQVRNVTYFKF
ncbi:hypothetical protein CLK_1763 [Clostridium botulinum A3 str. Loch Maree]|nr:hypothetical protein CLK_1763 [Clostridium botulinum A3 str. Loch Maree]